MSCYIVSECTYRWKILLRSIRVEYCQMRLRINRFIFHHFILVMIHVTRSLKLCCYFNPFFKINLSPIYRRVFATWKITSSFYTSISSYSAGTALIWLHDLQCDVQEQSSNKRKKLHACISKWYNLTIPAAESNPILGQLTLAHCVHVRMKLSLVHRYAVNRAHRYRESVFGSVFLQVKNRYAYRIE